MSREKLSVGRLWPVLMALALMLAPLALTGCPAGGGGGERPVTGVTITGANVTPGAPGQFALNIAHDADYADVTAVLAPADASNQRVTWSIVTGGTYVSLPANVNTLAIRLDVTNRPGTAHVRVVTEDGSFTANLNVTIQDEPGVANITVAPTSLVFDGYDGVSAQTLTATVNLDAGADAADFPVTWSIATGEAFVSISSTTGLTTTVTPLAFGTATIVATAGTASSTPVTVIVRDPAAPGVESIAIQGEATRSIYVSDYVILEANVVLEAGADAADFPVFWSIYGVPPVPPVVELYTLTPRTVRVTGLVAGGPVQIQAMADGVYSATVSITVETAPDCEVCGESPCVCPVLIGAPQTVNRTDLDIVLGHLTTPGVSSLPEGHFAPLNLQSPTVTGAAVMGFRGSYVYVFAPNNASGLQILPPGLSALQPGDVLLAAGRTTGNRADARLELNYVGPDAGPGAGTGFGAGSIPPDHQIANNFVFSRVLTAEIIERGLRIAPNSWDGGSIPTYFAFSIDDLIVSRPPPAGTPVIHWALRDDGYVQGLDDDTATGLTGTGHIGVTDATVTALEYDNRMFLSVTGRTQNHHGVDVLRYGDVVLTTGDRVIITGRTGANWPTGGTSFITVCLNGSTGNMRGQVQDPGANAIFTIDFTIGALDLPLITGNYPANGFRIMTQGWGFGEGTPPTAAQADFHIYDIVIGRYIDPANPDHLPAFWPPVAGAPVISITPASPTIAAGQTQQLAVTVDPTGANFGTITWTSSAPAVATVSATGLVTALTEGTATITAASSESIISNATTVVTVTPPVDILPWQWVPADMGQPSNPAAWTSTGNGTWTTINGISWLRNGGANQATVNATGIDLNNTLLVLGASNLPSGTVPANQRDTAADRHIPGAFNFSTPAMLYIDFHSTSTDGAGRFQVQVNNTTGTAGNTVHAAPATLFRVFNVRAAELYRHAVGSPAASDITAATPGTLRIPIALVAEEIPNQQHLATSTLSLRAEGGGQLIITRVRLERYTPVEPTSVTIDPASDFSLAPTGTRQLSAAPVSTTTPWFVRWSTSDAEVATVNADGLVTAVAPGHADIVATVGGENATVRVTVPTGAGISISFRDVTDNLAPDSVTINAGDPIAFSISGSAPVTITVTDPGGYITWFRGDGARITTGPSGPFNSVLTLNYTMFAPGIGTQFITVGVWIDDRLYGTRVAVDVGL